MRVRRTIWRALAPEHLRWLPLSLPSNYASIIRGSAACGKLFRRAARRRAELRALGRARKEERDRETETRRLSRNQWVLEWSEKDTEQGKKKKVGKSVRKIELRWRQKVRERGLEGLSERPASHNVASDSLYSRRQASTNEQSYKLITYQTESGEWGRGRWGVEGEVDSISITNPPVDAE